MQALDQVQDIESYARTALRGCGDYIDYNPEKALRILRTCVVSSINIQIGFYSSLRAYNPRWILEITEKTISATVGLVGSSGANFYDQFEAALQQTVKEHFEAEAAALKIPKKTKAAAMPASIKEQINKLREESRLSVEQLADGIGIEPRSVYRHLSGEATPRKRQIAAYETLFSQHLDKKVRLQTSSKRQ